MLEFIFILIPFSLGFISVFLHLIDYIIADGVEFVKLRVCYLVSRAAIMIMIRLSARGIQNGARTQIHDQLITLHNLRITKATPSRAGAIPLKVTVTFLSILKSPLV
jgi:hypothetical protein